MKVKLINCTMKVKYNLLRILNLIPEVKFKDLNCTMKVKYNLLRKCHFCHFCHIKKKSSLLHAYSVRSPSRIVKWYTLQVIRYISNWFLKDCTIFLYIYLYDYKMLLFVRYKTAILVRHYICSKMPRKGSNTALSLIPVYWVRLIVFNSF